MNARIDKAAWTAAGALALVVTLLYWWHAAPSFTFRDSAVFAMAAATYGIPHPPGASTWVILAGTFGRLVPVEDWARATNLFCGLMGGITVGLVCLYIYTLLHRVSPGLDRAARIAASVSGALILAGSPGFIEQSTTTEQYTLLTAINMAMLLLAWAILEGEHSPARKRWLLVAVGILWGLGHGNHPSQIHLVVFSGFLALAVAFRDRIDTSWTAQIAIAAKTFGWIFAGFLCGSLVFLWLPLRSHANPLLDWGDIETPRRLLWAIRREQWHGRPISEAPDGFVWEWLWSYHLLREIGVAGVLLALGGLWLALRRAAWHLGLLALVVVPFLAGIMVGHMGQEGMSITYIRFYKVSDWHLPLYMGAGILAGLSAGWLCGRLAEVRGAVLARVLSIVLAIGFAAFAGTAIWANSLRNLTAHETYIQALLEPLPEDAMIVLSTDNLAFNLAYHAYIQEPSEPRAVLWSADTVCKAIVKAGEREGWNAAERADYYANSIDNREKNMMNSPLPGAEAFASRPLFGEFDSTNASSHRHLLPAGFLVEARNEPTTNEEFLAEDALFWQREHVRPESVFYHHERTAWSQLWHRRGDLFYARALWEPAARAYEQAVAFQPAQGLLNYRLGECLERLGDAARAEALYRRAIEFDPWQSGPYLLLGMAEARRGNFREALRLIDRELELNPENQDAVRMRDAVAADLQRSGN